MSWGKEDTLANLLTSEIDFWFVERIQLQMVLQCCKDFYKLFNLVPGIGSAEQM